MENNLIAKNYAKTGYVISKCLFDENEILSLRKELDKEFSEHKEDQGASRFIEKFNNTELVKKLIKLYNSDHIKTIKRELQELSKKNVSILPPLEVHKNYHVNLKETHGWHRDCGGEMRYNYCNNILFKKDYLFSKVGIYLQDNSDFGGSIDIIEKSHKNFSKLKIFIRKIKSLPLKIITSLNKYLNKLYLLIPENFFMFVINGKKLYPEKGTAVFFDSRLIHRGSPISKKNLNDIKYVQGKYTAILPKAFDKYSIYCHFGTTEAVDSYMFDRLKRDGKSNELKKWIRQIKFISKYDKNLSEEIALVMNPIIEKYGDHL